MRALVVFESMYGNTRRVAEAIAAGIGSGATVVPVAAAAPELVAAADLLVVGGPTHVMSWSGPSSRRAAVKAAQAENSGLQLQPGADGIGLREWTATLRGPGRVAVFETRLRSRFAGHASRPLRRALRARGFAAAAEPMPFFVTKANRLVDGEEARARAWGQALATAESAPVTSPELRR